MTTSNGFGFLITGNALGGGTALLIFSLLVITYPLLLDRDIDLVIATGLLGFLIAMPLLGHRTWHVYRRTIATPS
jgi:uncharacterized membrane protein